MFTNSAELETKKELKKRLATLDIEELYYELEDLAMIATLSDKYLSERYDMLEKAIRKLEKKRSK